MIKKITTGHVIQTFTERGKFTGQKFIAGDRVEFEDEKGKPRIIGSHVYQPFDMVQPNTMAVHLRK